MFNSNVNDKKIEQQESKPLLVTLSERKKRERRVDDYENGFQIPSPNELFTRLKLKRRKNLEHDRKISRSLALLVIAFFICWFPYTLIALIDAICLNRSNHVSCINSSVFEIVFWLLWLNSTINPFLYPFFQKSFRKAYKSMFSSLLRKIKCKKKNSF